jgi:nucleoid DNA-binding protein
MEQLVRTYLLQKSSISIPGLGTIYVERSPARSDFINKQLLPPSYHFRFDKYFDAPGKEFFTYLASKKNIEDYEAIKVYNEWAHSLRNNIGTDQSVTLDGIGMLKRDLAGDVLFEAVAAPETYNISVPAKRLVRTNVKHTMIVGDREVSNVEMTDYLHDEVHKEKTSWWIYALIIAAVALTAILFHYFRSGNAAPFGNHQTIQPK